MKNEIKYPYGEWEKTEDDCPVCDGKLENYIVDEPSGGRMIAFIKAERCETCGWEHDFN